MANWFDIVSLVLTFSFFGGVIYGVVVVANKLKEAVGTTKESLKNKGLHITDKGVSLKTSSRYSREDYIDATQRGFIKSMSAASFGTAENVDGVPAQLVRKDSVGGGAPSSSKRDSAGSTPLRRDTFPAPTRQDSFGSSGSNEEKPKRGGIFRKMSKN